ncbi:MAG: hypothetical protein GY720_23800 [bacterium]|nr:hypothetical protein [bacterium]
MAEALKRLLQTVRFERDAFVWMDFNDRATGDAFVFVGVTRLLILLGMAWRIIGFVGPIAGFEILVQATINALIFWLMYSGIAFAATKYLFQGSGSYAVFLRITGFAYPTLLLVIFTDRLGLSATAALVAGSVWFLAIVTMGVKYEGDLPTERAALVAVAGLVGWIIVSAIFGRGII